MIFVSQIVPNELEILDQRVSNAAQIYQQKFIDFTNPTITISIYPHFIKSLADHFDPKLRVHYLNKEYKLGIGAVSSAAKLLLNSYKALTIILSQKKEEVWFYNLNLSTVLIVFFTRFIFNRPTFIILAD